MKYVNSQWVDRKKYLSDKKQELTMEHAGEEILPPLRPAPR